MEEREETRPYARKTSLVVDRKEIGTDGQTQRATEVPTDTPYELNSSRSRMKTTKENKRKQKEERKERK